ARPAKLKLGRAGQFFKDQINIEAIVVEEGGE
ncbi:MAG: hypothetical protein M1267_02465, partial [Candidatus Thermoplasmatota archaeon]|nr:hypothetical protein [Candidatus Thermoplasmatota archaeon]